MANVFETKTCSECGKVFIPGAEHIYRYESTWQCTYTCYRKAMNRIKVVSKRGHKNG